MPNQWTGVRIPIVPLTGFLPAEYPAVDDLPPTDPGSIAASAPRRLLAAEPFFPAEPAGLLAQWVKNIRGASGLLQTELARRLGAHQETVVRWEHERVTPTFGALLQLTVMELEQLQAGTLPAEASSLGFLIEALIDSGDDVDVIGALENLVQYAEGIGKAAR